MAYTLALPAYICQRGTKTVFPSSTFRLPTRVGLPFLPTESINSSPSSVLLTPLNAGPSEPHPVMPQILSENQNMHPASYPTAYRDLNSKIEYPSMSTPSLPFPVVDYFVYVAWDVINGMIDSALSASHPNPPTPPPQAPTLQPEPAFRDYIQRLITTTAVSQSVVIIALYYLYKVRAYLHRRLVMGDIVDKRQGYSMCAASLMLGNKFLDDNTYTSRTWATLSGYTLWEINDCERELLRAMDFQLNISLQQYNDWWSFLTMYQPSVVTYLNNALLDMSLSCRPLTAESFAPIMPVSHRRIARVEGSSRPGSRKRSHADAEVDGSNKRSTGRDQVDQFRAAATSQRVVYQTPPYPATISQPQVGPCAPVQQQPLAPAHPFCSETGDSMLEYPLGYYKLIASPADPRVDDHYRKVQLVQPSQQQVYMPQMRFPSALYPSIIYPNGTRRLSDPTLVHSSHPVITVSTHPYPLDDYPSFGDYRSLHSPKISRQAGNPPGASAMDNQAFPLHPFSFFPQTTIDFGQLDGLYPLKYD